MIDLSASLFGQSVQFFHDPLVVLDFPSLTTEATPSGNCVFSVGSVIELGADPFELGIPNGFGRTWFTRQGAFNISSSLSGASSLAADLRGAGALLSTLSGTGAISQANLQGAGRLSGVLTGNGSIAQAALTGIGTSWLTAVLSGTSSFVADLRGVGALSGTLSGTSGCVAALLGLLSVSATLSGAGAITQAALTGHLHQETGTIIMLATISGADWDIPTNRWSGNVFIS